jgi:hypothetical protein
MSATSSVEEVLTRTLKRAGELAIPGDVHAPLQIVDRIDLGGSGYGESEPLARRSTRPALRVAVTGIAAMILVAIGLAALVIASPSSTIQRTRLSALQGEQLLCGTQNCVTSDHEPALANPSAATAATPSFGDAQRATPSTPRDTWILASGGRFVRIIKGSTGPVTHSVPGTVYLSAGQGRYYRFATGREDGPLSVVGHGTHRITLKGADGSIYVLNLGTSELVPQR